MRRLLVPLAWAYGAAAAVRRHAYDRGCLPIGQAGVPVISVGALEAGGSGKTPVAGWLAGWFLERGLSVGLVAGGYGGSESHRVHRIDPAWRWQSGAAERFGDESLLLASWHPQAIIFCGRDKLAAAVRAVEVGAQLVIVDDGFQHQRLHRDLDLLLDDGTPPDWPFPAGLARELPRAAQHAHLRWQHQRWHSDQLDTEAPVASRCVPVSLHSLTGAPVGAAADLRGRRVFLLAGIARPVAFRRTVEALGATVLGHAWARDHAVFGNRHLRTAARSGADLLLCTEKDAARLGGSSPVSDLVYLSCRVELTRGLVLLRERMTQLLSGEGLT